MSNINTVFLDAGHGGINPEGIYTTAPSKMYFHKQPFYKGQQTFYEGVKNRLYCDYLYKLLTQSGVNVVKVYHDYEDTDLKIRTDLANYYNKNVSKGIYVSEHSNATAEGRARGFCAFTTRGNGTSDKLAQKFIDMYKEKFPHMRVLEDNRDGDSDYEADFWVLRSTDMPAVLLENLFFDNPKDAEVLYDNYYLTQYVQLQHD